MKINSNHCYLAFDREIASCKRWLQSKVLSACGYSTEVLLDRLMQRVVEIILGPYVSLVRSTFNGGASSFPLRGDLIHCKRCSLAIGTGELGIDTRQLISNQAEFLMHWGYCLVAMLPRWAAKSKNIPAVLVFGVGEESLFADGNDQRFVWYCRQGPISPLRNACRIITQTISTTTSSSDPKFSYCRNPLIKLLHETRLTFSGRLLLIADHLILLFQYLFAVFQFPQISLLGRDFAYSSISRELDRRRQIEAIVLTTSNYTRQPLWMRALGYSRVHMISYSQNWKPITYATDCLESDVPNLRWMRVDTHWVWTHTFASYLRTLGHTGDVKVEGPILFYLPEMGSPRADQIEIVIFDVPAVSDEVMFSIGEFTNYYRIMNLSAFVRDIVTLRRSIEDTFGLPVRVRLKTKRGYAATYDKDYFEHLEQLEASGVLSLEHHSTNMYSLISSSHLVIAYPFTSPAGVADALKVPSIYYDPTGMIVEHHFSDAPSLIHFANSPANLLDVAVSVLRNSFRTISND